MNSRDVSFRNAADVFRISWKTRQKLGALMVLRICFISCGLLNGDGCDECGIIINNVKLCDVHFMCQTCDGVKV